MKIKQYDRNTELNCEDLQDIAVCYLVQNHLNDNAHCVMDLANRRMDIYWSSDEDADDFCNIIDGIAYIISGLARRLAVLSYKMSENPNEDCYDL